MTEIKAAQTGLEDIEEALKDVIDPELGVNIVDLGLLYGLKYSDDDGALLIDMTLTTAACPLTDVIEEQVGKALDGVVDDWRLNWVWMPPWGPPTAEAAESASFRSCWVIGSRNGCPSGPAWVDACRTQRPA